MKTNLSVEKAVYRFAGFMVLLSVVLTYSLSPHFIWLTAFVGLNLMQFSFTGFCPVTLLFKKLGLKSEADIALANHTH